MISISTKDVSQHQHAQTDGRESGENGEGAMPKEFSSVVSQINIPQAVVIGFSCRAVAESLLQTRRKVAVIDCCGDLDTRLMTDWVGVVGSLSETERILQILEGWFSEFGQCPILLAGGTENQPELLEAIDARWPGCLPKADWNALRDWRRWESWAKQSGFHFPKTYALESNVLATETGLLDQPFLHKRLDGAGGGGVKLFENVESFERFSQGKDLANTLVQQALPGRVIGVHFFSSDERSQLLGVVEGIPTMSHPNGDFVYLGSRGPIYLKAVEALLLERFADMVSRESGLRGTWNADFIDTPQGWHLIEINPRWSAGLEVLELCAPPVVATNAESGTLHVNAPKFAVKRIVYAAEDFQISSSQVQMLVNASLFGEGRLSLEYSGDHEMLANDSVVRIADISEPESCFQKGMPLCTILVTGNSREDVSRGVLAGLDWIRKSVGVSIV